MNEYFGNRLHLLALIANGEGERSLYIYSFLLLIYTGQIYHNCMPLKSCIKLIAESTTRRCKWAVCVECNACIYTSAERWEQEGGLWSTLYLKSHAMPIIPWCSIRPRIIQRTSCTVLSRREIIIFIFIAQTRSLTLSAAVYMYSSSIRKYDPHISTSQIYTYTRALIIPLHFKTYTCNVLILMVHSTIYKQALYGNYVRCTYILLLQAPYNIVKIQQRCIRLLLIALWFWKGKKNILVCHWWWSPLLGEIVIGQYTRDMICERWKWKLSCVRYFPVYCFYIYYIPVCILVLKNSCLCSRSLHQLIIITVNETVAYAGSTTEMEKKWKTTFNKKKKTISRLMVVRIINRIVHLAYTATTSKWNLEKKKNKVNKLSILESKAEFPPEKHTRSPSTIKNNRLV